MVIYMCEPMKSLCPDYLILTMVLVCSDDSNVYIHIHYFVRKPYLSFILNFVFFIFWVYRVIGWKKY